MRFLAELRSEFDAAVMADITAFWDDVCVVVVTDDLSQAFPVSLFRVCLEHGCTFLSPEP